MKKVAKFLSAKYNARYVYAFAISNYMMIVDNNLNSDCIFDKFAAKTYLIHIYFVAADITLKYYLNGNKAKSVASRNSNISIMALRIYCLQLS